MTRPAALLCAVTVLVAVLMAAARSTHRTAADEPAPATDKPDAAAAKEALGAFNEFIGAWRGVGQPRRGSRDGAWLESTEWVWEFDPTPALRLDVSDGKLLSTARLIPGKEAGAFRLEATLPDESRRTYTGTLDDEKLVLESRADKDGHVHRVTMRPLNEKRMLILFEQRRESQTFYARVAEIGYTRQGESLASGSAGPECVVTGGKGTIKVSYKGESYYVCCTGCQQAFEADPAGTLADYRQKLAERKAKAGGE